MGGPDKPGHDKMRNDPIPAKAQPQSRDRVLARLWDHSGAIG
jgi:hypothetical protein